MNDEAMKKAFGRMKVSNNDLDSVMEAVTKGIDLNFKVLRNCITELQTKVTVLESRAKHLEDKVWHERST